MVKIFFVVLTILFTCQSLYATTLNEAISYAVNNSRTRQLGDLELEVEKLKVGVGYATFGPKISASYSSSLTPVVGTLTNPIGSISETTNDVRYNTYTKQFRVEQNLAFYKLLPAQKVRIINAQTKEQSRRSIMNSIVVNTVNVYMNLIRARKSLIAAELDIKLQDQLLRVAEAKLKDNAISIHDFRSIEIAQANSIANKIKCEADLNMATSDYENKINDQHQKLEIPSKTPEIPYSNINDALQAALQNNPDIRRSSSQIEADKYDLISAQSNLLPDVSVSYVDAAGSGFVFSPQLSYTTKALMLNISISITDKIHNWSNIGTIHKKHKIDVIRNQMVRDDISANAKKLWIYRESLLKLQDARKMMLKAAKERFSKTQTGFKNGRETLSDVLNAQYSLYIAEIQLIDIMRNILENTYNIMGIVGINEFATYGLSKQNL